VRRKKSKLASLKSSFFVRVANRSQDERCRMEELEGEVKKGRLYLDAGGLVQERKRGGGLGRGREKGDFPFSTRAAIVRLHALFTERRVDKEKYLFPLTLSARPAICSRMKKKEEEEKEVYHHRRASKSTSHLTPSPSKKRRKRGGEREKGTRSPGSRTLAALGSPTGRS